MGTCYGTNADRTKFIIEEDYRMKQEMIRTFQKYVKIRQEKLEEIYEEQQKISDGLPKRNFPGSDKTINSNEKIISRNQNNLTEIYNVEKQLGEGGYGQVFLVRHKKMNLLRAMKMISVNSKNEEEQTDEEIELLKQLDHPNIVKLFEYFSDEDKYYLITEYCKGGDLFDLIKKKRKFSEMSAAYIMYQIFRALFYCHSTHHLMHRDIKPENIVVFKENNTGEDLYGVKLIDFGIAKIFNKLDKNKEQKIKGSFNYIAPEVIKRNYDEKCDIWSCGVILYILVIGTYPFNGNDKNEILYNIEHGNYTFPEWFIQNSSPQIKDLIQQCLKVNPSSRISAKQALEHPLFELYEIKEFFINVTESFLNKTINNIKNYKIKNSLQELTFTYLVHNYPNQYEITLLYRVFNKFNICNDGKLTKDELKNGLMEYLFKDKTSREASEKEANIIFEKLDWNNNGYIECEEFVRAGIDKRLLKSEKVLRFTFDYLDKNKDGKISIDELIEVFGIVSQEDERQMVELVKSIDRDLDGQISFYEFYGMMLKIIDGLL